MTVGQGPSQGDDAEPNPNEGQITARLTMPLRDLGMASPPVTVHLKLFDRPEGHRVYAWNREGDREPVVRWLGQHMQGTLLHPREGNPRVIFLDVERLPDQWEPLVEDLALELMVARPDGTVDVSVKGERDALQRLAGADARPGSPAEVRRVKESEEQRPEILTKRQEEALLQALSAGYFDVPRTAHLAELAEEMSISEGSLSELLRRAEGRVLRYHFGLVDEEGREQEPSPGQPGFEGPVDEG